LATIHDGFLLECPRDRVAEAKGAIDSAMQAAVDDVFPGAPMRWAVEVFPERYQDADGEKLWRLIDGILTPKRASKRGRKIIDILS
jgi:hypothetical protein